MSRLGADELSGFNSNAQAHSVCVIAQIDQPDGGSIDRVGRFERETPSAEGTKQNGTCPKAMSAELHCALSGAWSEHESKQRPLQVGPDRVRRTFEKGPDFEMVGDTGRRRNACHSSVTNERLIGLLVTPC